MKQLDKWKEKYCEARAKWKKEGNPYYDGYADCIDVECGKLLKQIERLEAALEKCKYQRDGFISSRFLSENPPVKYKGEDIYFDNCAEILDKEIDDILKG